MRKVIFLDIDGVLNTEYWYSQKERDQYGHTFDPASVANLAKIIEKTGAEIVISSSWKYMGLETIQMMWKERMLPGKVIGITPESVNDDYLLHADLKNINFFSIRGQEINDWMMLHGKDVSHYVIIDDMDFPLKEQQSHFVMTHPNVGITEWDAMKAIAILNAEPSKDIDTIIRELQKEKNRNENIFFPYKRNLSDFL